MRKISRSSKLRPSASLISQQLARSRPIGFSTITRLSALVNSASRRLALIAS